MMDLQEGIKRALDGHGLLFLGAGFAYGATNLRGQRYRTGDALAEYLARLSNITENVSLEDAAESYAEQFGTDALIHEIQKEYTVKNIQDYHQKIASIPWKRIYTTNYDNIIERAYSAEGKRLTPVTLSSDIFKIPKNDTLCVHLNGFVDKLDRDTIWTELKLTETSYVTASIAESPWASKLREDVRAARAVFLIGYSLYDLDIKRILAAAQPLKDKAFFFIGSNPLKATELRCKRFGTVLSDTAESFARTVQEVRKVYSPSKKSDFMGLSIIEYKIPPRTKKISDRSFMDLLLFGKRNNALICESLSSGARYLLERSSIKDVFNLIERGKRIIVICSDLGNGKSLFLEGLRLRAIENGMRVFEVKEHTEDVADELEKLAKLKDRFLLTIEEYQNWLSEIHSFWTNASDQAILILTCRNAVHDLTSETLMRKTGVDNIPEIRLDVLRQEEIEWFVEAFEEYGLWGKMASRSKQKKIEFLDRVCRKQIHAILLKLLESPDIGDRLQRITEGIKGQTESYTVLLTVFILTIINYRASLDTLADIWGAELINSPKLRKNYSLKELVDFNRYEIFVHSPIIAEYYLRKIGDASTVVPVLIKMANRIHDVSKYSRDYEKLFRNLMRFSNLQLILPEENRSAAVIQYYEATKNLRNCKNYPLFWLQYAIASLFINDLYRARKFFDTAYSLAQKRQWDTYQIDNHFARFLIVEACQEYLHQPNSAMANFKKAHNILSVQMKNERLHYPYRVAIGYQDFIDRFGKTLDTSQLDFVLQSAQTVYNRIMELPEERRMHDYVIDCKKAMEYVESRIENILSS